QIGRIARLLAVDPDDVQGLDDIGDEDLRTLHDLISGMLSASGQEPFARVASLSKLLPGAVAGKLAERFLPPELAARVAVLLEPAKARELVTKVSVDYLAELSLALDPVRSRAVVQAIPADRVAQVARALFDRGEYAAMAEFAGTVTLDGLFGALGIASARDLVEVVPLLVWNDNIDKVVADIPAAKIDSVLAEIVEHDLWGKAEYLVGRLRPDVIGTLARGLFERRQYGEMARFVGIVRPEHLFAALDVATARDLLEVVPLLEWNDNIDKVVAGVPAERIEQILDEVADAKLWEQGNYLIEHFEGDARKHVVARAAEISDDAFATLRTAAADGKLGAAAVALLDEAQNTRKASL
ncbi:MAG: hypothetical protein ABI232_05610, partial [Jatrophihabitantaceae bacterium]